MFGAMKRVLAAFIVAIAATAFVAARAEPPATPTLVELFTSQGCSSCPPADAFVAELAGRDDVIALSMHVTTWDYIGWTDPFGSEAATNRQKAYGRRLNRGMIYTPQMVIDGTYEEVGSNRMAVKRAIAKASAAPGLAIELALENDDLLVSIPGAHFEGAATVWLARYDAERVTEIPRGENSGRRLRNVNVVRDLREIGAWTGLPLELRLPASLLTSGEGGRDGCVVIVQEDGFGRVLGARRMALSGGSS